MPARTKSSLAPSDGHGDENATDDEREVKAEPGCSARCGSRAVKRAAESSDERRHLYDAAAILRSDALRALKSARLAVDDAVRTLEHAASAAEKAYGAELDASSASRSKSRHHGEPANGRGHGEGGGW